MKPVAVKFILPFGQTSQITSRYLWNISPLLFSIFFSVSQHVSTLLNISWVTYTPIGSHDALPDHGNSIAITTPTVPSKTGLPVLVCMCMYVCVCVCARTRVCMCVCACVQVCLCAHAYTCLLSWLSIVYIRCDPLHAYTQGSEAPNCSKM